MKRYISMYLKIAPETFARMHQNVKEQNWKDLAINAHSLKPQAEYMGLSQLKDLLIQIEQHAKKGQVKRLPNLFQQSYRHMRKGLGL
jgi:HPt (histidine-containing phosphotransfer) domain-containing protein